METSVGTNRSSRNQPEGGVVKRESLGRVVWNDSRKRLTRVAWQSRLERLTEATHESRLAESFRTTHGNDSWARHHGYINPHMYLDKTPVITTQNTIYTIIFIAEPQTCYTHKSSISPRRL